MSTNTVELEGLVVGPYLWSAAKCYQFCNNAFNLFSKKDVQFEKELNAGSDQVLGTSNFTDMLGADYWSVLKHDEKRKDRYNLDGENDVGAAEKKKSVIWLLKLIRDKIAHIRDYKDNVKEKLNQVTTNGRRFQFFYRNKKGLYQLDENQFVAFWIFKFPKLLPYLWLKFYQFEKELAIYKYYPDNKIKINDFKDTYLDLNQYGEKLRTALECDIENGNIFKRFTGPGCCTLEFRGFHNLEAFRDSNKCIALALNSKVNVVLSVSHSCTSTDTIEYMGATPGTDKLILIFASDITDDKVWKICNDYDCRIIVFCDPRNLTTEKVKEGVSKFIYGEELTECPVRGSELSQAKQGWVFEYGQVGVQGMDMRIKDMFSNSSVMSGILSGNLLSKLLKNEKPTMLGNYIYPEYNGVYIERKLVFNQNVNDVRLECIYVAVNCIIENLSYYGDTQVFNNIKHLIDNIDSVQIDCEFILLKEHNKISKEIMERCDTAFFPKIVRFLDNGWIDLDSKNSRIYYHPQMDKDNCCVSETEFLKMTSHKGIKTSIFRAASGMGKSKLLISLGKQIENTIVVFCAFNKFVDILQKIVGTTECTKSNVKCGILKILGCEDECEKNVIDSWLDRKGGAGTKLELQLDGLDEVPSKHLKLALKMLKIIENDFESVRLRITSSKPFPSELEGIKFVELNICPFTYYDKIEFFVRCWTGKNNKETIEWSRQRIKNFLAHVSNSSFFKPIITKQNELTDYPLFCNMLAELYEEDFTKHFTLSTSLNLIDLYESLTKKKFASMIKKKTGKEPDKNDNDFKVLEESYMHVHKYFALVHLFPEVSNNSARPWATKFLTQKNICKMRIITNIEIPAFVHLSYAHFFAALFIIDGIKTGDFDNLSSKETFDNFVLSGTPDESNLNMIIPIWEYVNSFLGKVMDWRSLKWLESQNTYTISNVHCSSTFLAYAIENSLWALATLLIILQKGKMDSSECNKILHRAISLKAPSNCVIEMCEKLSFDNQNKLLICSVENGQYEIAKYLINTWCGNKGLDEIAAMSGCGIFHFIIYVIPEPYFKFAQESIFEDTKEFIMFVHEKNPEEIKRMDSRGQSLLLALPFIQSSYYLCTEEEILSLKKFLVEDLNADVNVRSFDGESVLCLGLWSLEDLTEIRLATVEDEMIYHETLALLATKNFAHINLKSKMSGLTPLWEAVQYFGQKMTRETLELFHDLGANFNELDNCGKTILHYSADYYDDIEFIKMLVDHGSKIDVQNREGLCALCFTEKEGKIELGIFFREKLNLRKDESCKLNCVIKQECE